MAAQLWWGMFSFSALVFALVLALWLYAQFRTPRNHDDTTRQRIHRRWIIGGGLILPLTSVSVLLAFGIPAGHRMLPLPVDGTPAFRIEVEAHQWFWRVHYPDHDIELIDRLVMPADRPVDIHVRSADVIHAFWVPRLGGKIDALPGRTNVLRLHADAPGEYRGQCAEFCGTQHAHMAFTVDALEPADFDDWLEAQ